MVDARQLEAAIWSIADGRGSDDDLAVLHADARASLLVLDRLIYDAEEDLDAVRNLPGDERYQVVADFTETLESLRDTAAILRPRPVRNHDNGRGAGHDVSAGEDEQEQLEPEEVRLQASWSDGHVVVWAAGRGAMPDQKDDLSTRLEANGAPPVGWEPHAGVPLPGGLHADAFAISLRDALGWLVALGKGLGREGAGASLAWLGSVAVEGVRLTANGSIVPSLRVTERSDVRGVEGAVRWIPALVDRNHVDALALAMPGTVVAIGGTGRHTGTAVINEVIAASCPPRRPARTPPPTWPTR
jgi:hypothetical protein